MITGTSHDFENDLLRCVVEPLVDDDADAEEDDCELDAIVVEDAADPLDLAVACCDEVELLVIDADGESVAVVGVVVVDVVVAVELCVELLGEGEAVDGDVVVVGAGAGVAAVAVPDEEPPITPPLLPPSGPSGGPPGGPSPWTGGMAHTMQVLMHSTYSEMNRRRLGAAMALVS